MQPEGKQQREASKAAVAALQQLLKQLTGEVRDLVSWQHRRYELEVRPSESCDTASRKSAGETGIRFFRVSENRALPWFMTWHTSWRVP